MSKEILDLEPKEVWKYFYELTQIPRPSKKEGRVIEFMKEFGEKIVTLIMILKKIPLMLILTGNG